MPETLTDPITDVEQARELAQAENTARAHYRPAVLEYKSRFALGNTLAFVGADIENTDVVYHGMNRVQTVHHATVVRQLVTAELERREAAEMKRRSEEYWAGIDAADQAFNAPGGLRWQ